MIIIVNGREKLVESETISFHELVSLAYDRMPIGFPTITYGHGPAANPEGSLLARDNAVQVTNGMIFDVIVTGNA